VDAPRLRCTSWGLRRGREPTDGGLRGFTGKNEDVYSLTSDQRSASGANRKAFAQSQTSGFDPISDIHRLIDWKPRRLIRSPRWRATRTTPGSSAR